MSERTGQIDLARRRLLQSFGAGLAAPVMLAGLIGPEIGRVLPQPAPEEAPVLKGPYELGNLKLSVLAMGHTREDWEKHQSTVTSLLDRFPVIIPEYLPTEFKGSQDPWVAKAEELYKDQNLLFYKVEDYAKAAGKEVWVLDPAYDSSIIHVSAALRAAEAGAFIGTPLALMRKLSKSGPNFLLNRPRFKVLLNSAAFLLGAVIPPEAVALANEQSILAVKGERQTRYALLERSFQQLSQHVPTGTEALAIYHQNHWARMEERIMGPAITTDDLTVSTLRATPTLGSLFQVRNYKSVDNEWVKQPGFRI